MGLARTWTVVAIFCGFLASASGCELIAQVDRSKIPSTGGGGFGGTGGTGATGGTGGTGGSACVPEDDTNECTDDKCNDDNTTAHNPTPAGSPCTVDGSMCDGAGKCVECLAPSDCPGEDNACQTRTCSAAGKCGLDFVAADTPIPTQTIGDCKVDVCDGAGAIVPANDDLDLPDDSEDCTDDTCTAGVPANTPKAEGTSCGTAGSPLVCNATGQCIGCNAPADCGVDDECTTYTCVNEVCGVDFTAADTPVLGQTDNDCLVQVCDGNGNIAANADDNDLPTDDGNACTDEACAAGTQQHPAKANGFSCDDSDACTLLDTCQAGVCESGTAVTCTAQDQCHDAGTCDPATGMCSNPAKADGASCDDSDACTQTDACQSGVCTGGNPVTCLAQDQCHVAGTCNPATGTCSNPAKADGASCDDSDACTQTDTCQTGVCTGGNPVTCPVPDQCHTAGTCNPANGVCSNPAKADGVSCDDNDACTQTDTCQTGVCTGGNPVTCPVPDQCHTAGTCNPANGVCSNPAKANGTSCDDNDACTQTDTCQTGVCTGGNPVTCPVPDQCHTAGTCNPANGVCSNPPKGDGAACNDNDACTQTDTCQTGVCTGGNPVVCNSPGQCQNPGACVAATGACAYPPKPDGTACVVGISNGTCAAGACQACGNGMIDPGEDCEDGNLVNGDGCDNNCKFTGCGNGVASAGEDCDDGNGVNGDGCDDGPGGNCTATGCGNGVVTAGETCDDGNLLNGDGCDDGLGGNCTATGCGNGVVSAGEICDDGNDTNGDGCDDGPGGNCTATACGNGVVTAGEVCDDGNSTLGDGCDDGASGNCTASGCGNGVRAGAEACDDGNTIGNDGCSANCTVEVPYTCTTAIPDVCTSPVEINCNDGKDNDGDGLFDLADPDCALAQDPNVGACAAGETHLVYTNAVSTPIPDNTPAGVTSTITVGGLGLVKRAVLKINVNHTYDGDLDIFLISPANVSVDASSDNGGSNNDYINTVFNTACATAITAGAPPFTGCFKPEATFNVFNNGAAKGNWGLKLVDQANLDTGTLNSWQLDLCVQPTLCGNGATDAGEQCEDGNLVNGDGCDNNCTTTACGNGIVTAGEACDDGNGVDGDGCDSNCKVTACGNGIQTGTEGCDDGNAVNGDGCDSNCKPTGCGNGIITAGEQCEDGNLVDGDGCSSTCQWENVVPEVEPNGTFLEADTALPIISSNTNVTGTIVNPDKDIFKVTVTAATVVRFEVFDSTGLDCPAAIQAMTLKLFDTVGVELKRDSPAVGLGNASGINNCPALAVYLTPADYYIQLEKTAAGSVPYFLQIKYLPDAGSEVEPNTTTAQATPLPGTAMYILGSHQVVTDTDMFAITVPQGASVRLETIEGNAETCESLDVDSTLNLLDPNGVVLGAGDGDDGRGYCSTIDGTGAVPRDAFAHNLNAGTYYVRVTSFSTSVTTANQFDYRLVVVIRTP